MKELNLLDGTRIGEGQRVFIIGEIGLCHDGDPEVARALIKGCKEAGVDAVKFQKRDVANLAPTDLLDAEDHRFPQFGTTYRQIREQVEFDMSTYRRLKQYAEDLGLPFLVSVFDEKSADQIAALGVPGLKIASHVLSRKPLIEHLCRLKLPVLVSTGMAFMEEIDETAAMFKAADVPFGLFHCVSIYPHAADQANLRMIRFLAERYDVPVGYSCHEVENVSSVLAVAAGATMLERHVTLDRTRSGFDHKFALDMEGLGQFVREVRQAEAAMGTTEKTVSAEEWVTRRKYHCSVVSRRDIRQGEVIDRSMLTVKNPGTGIPARQIDTVAGRRAAVDISADVLISEQMLD
jgi:sialic acid synthase SpsE